MVPGCADVLKQLTVFCCFLPWCLGLRFIFFVKIFFFSEKVDGTDATQGKKSSIEISKVDYQQLSALSTGPPQFQAHKDQIDKNGCRSYSQATSKVW